MNNNWNRIIYKIWSPVYDRIFNKGAFLTARKQLFKELKLNPNDKILFVGVGTGADLELIDHSSLRVTAIDYSPDMLKKARKKFRGAAIEFLEMDAQKLHFTNDSFDYVIGSLILSVVPDPKKSLQEMSRVVKPDGEIILFDKFASAESNLPFSKRLVRPVIKVLGTDIGLNFERLIEKLQGKLIIEEDTPLMLKGMYRKIVLKKQTDRQVKIKENIDELQ